MATAKTTALTFRFKPSLKEALRTAAHREHRSSANMVKVIAAHCAPSSASRKPTKPDTSAA
jgi:hypothetical protein